MQISKEEIENIKQTNNLVSVIESKGIKLKKRGKNYVALCPFHEEKTPSFTVDPIKQLWNCFGCASTGTIKTGGDVIGFLVRHDGLSFKDALIKLKGNGNNPKPAKKKKIEVPKPYTPKQIKLLKRVIAFYHKTFTEDPRGLKYLTDNRKITDKKIFSLFQVGFSKGTLLKVIPEEGDIIKDLQTIGILTETKKELFYDCVTFPIFNRAGEPVGMYARKIKDQEINHLYLPGPRQGLFNGQTAKQNKEIILTESIIDSLTLYAQGYKNTIPCYGTNGLTEHHIKLLKDHTPQTVYIAFDGDDTGRKGAKIVAQKLKEIEINAYILPLPEDQDINDYFKTEAPEAFRNLLNKANPNKNPSEKQESKDSENRKEDFTVACETRKYQIMGVQKSRTQLKATIKAVCLSDGKPKYHIDTTDFYSSRSRLFMAKALSELFGEDETIINGDLNCILEKIQNHEPKDSAKEEKVSMTGQEEKEALGFLNNPDLLQEILNDFETIGYTGEESNKLMGYIAGISRRMDEPLSLLIQSRSAAGKSTLQDAILIFVPPEDYIKYTRITGQALFYKDT